MRGKFIVLYGINNLGKTTQTKMLVDYFNKKGIQAEYLKYPIYDCQPTGPQINQIIRARKQTISEEELQALYIQNRRDYEPHLWQKLAGGINIMAEDYIGTGLAWGSAKGADLGWLERCNQGLLKPDKDILLDGERFLEAKEAKHVHEQNDELMRRCRKNYLKLAKKYHWPIVRANQNIAKVHQEIIRVLEG